MRLGHPRRQVRVAHVPAADHLAVRIDAGDDVVGPGVGAVVALAAQERGVAAFLARFVVAVVAVDLDEAAARQQRAKLGAAVDRQALHAGAVGNHVCLARQRQVAPLPGQVLAQRDLVDRQRHPVPGGAVARGIAPRVIAHARWAAHAGIDEGAVEARAARGQRVQAGRLQIGMAIAAQVIRPQLVGHDEQHILHRAHRRPPIAWP